MILNGLMALSDALWGTLMIVVLVSMGLYLSIRFHFYYNFRHIGFHFRIPLARCSSAMAAANNRYRGLPQLVRPWPIRLAAAISAA